MAFPFDVHVTSGIPDSGTGSVFTINTLMGIVGSTTDAASNVTDATAVTQVSLLKQISKSAQQVNTALSDKSQFTKITDGTDTALVDTHGSLQTTLEDSSGNAITFNTNGQVTKANSAPVVPASDWVYNTGNYCSIAASSVSSTIKMSGAGAAADYLHAVLVQPSTTNCGSVVVFDNALQVATFPGGGTTALLSLIPFTIPIGAVSSSGAWKATTGAGVAITAIGRF